MRSRLRANFAAHRWLQEHAPGLEEEMLKKRVRPSLLEPVTTCLGRAMPETVKDGMRLALSQEYNDQIRMMLEECPDDTALREKIRIWRDDMIERSPTVRHRDNYDYCTGRELSHAWQGGWDGAAEALAVCIAFMIMSNRRALFADCDSFARL